MYQIYITVIGAIIVGTFLYCTELTPVMNCIGLQKGENYFVVYQDGYRCSYNVYFYVKKVGSNTVNDSYDITTVENTTLEEVKRLYKIFKEHGYEPMEITDHRLLYEHYRLVEIEFDS
jgi:hypothetical protein